MACNLAEGIGASSVSGIGVSGRNQELGEKPRVGGEDHKMKGEDGERKHDLDGADPGQTGQHIGK